MDNTYELTFLEISKLLPLRRQMMEGERSDWFEPRRNHIISQTCGNFPYERKFLPRWDVQLAAILAHRNVVLEG